MLWRRKAGEPGRLFAEEAEDGGAGAGHGSVGGAAAVEVGDEGGDFGVAGADGGLEVVDDAAAPLLDWEFQGFPEG